MNKTRTKYFSLCRTHIAVVSEKLEAWATDKDSGLDCHTKILLKNNFVFFN